MDDGVVAAAAAAWRAKTPVDLPRRLAHEDYLEAERAYLRGITPLYPRAHLFRFGEWHTMGISDIDLACVVDDDIDTAALRRIEAIPRSPLIIHPPIVLPRNLMRAFRWFIPGGDLHATDPAYPVPEIDQPDARELADLCLITAFDTSLISWRSLRLEREEPELRVRSAMLKLWTVRHTTRFLERGGVEPSPEWRAYADDCADMREAFRSGEPVDLDRLAWNLARAEQVAREVATAGAEARRARSNAPEFTARSVRGGRVAVRTDLAPWLVRRRRYPFRRKLSYLVASLPRDVAAFALTSEGDSPFDRTLRTNRRLWTERTGFLEKHDVYALWSGKQFLGTEAKKPLARFRDRTMLALSSAMF